MGNDINHLQSIRQVDCVFVKGKDPGYLPSVSCSFLFCAKKKRTKRKGHFGEPHPRAKGAGLRGLLKLVTLLSAIAAAINISQVQRMCPNSGPEVEREIEVSRRKGLDKCAVAQVLLG